MKSIIFNQHQVNHALKNKEVMFRVVVKPQLRKGFLEYTVDRVDLMDKYPYQVGQKIFVKEAYDIWDDKILFKADATKQLRYLECKWKSPVHMKQEHSRLTLKIKSVKVERLQDISEKDAVKEGISERNIEQDFSAVEYFKEEWNSTHKKPEEKWEANPWVFVYECGKGLGNLLIFC